MAGIGAVNISHAAATAQSNTTAAPARDSSSSGGSSQASAISQIASQTAGEQVSDDDKQRTVQTPKQAEAGFSANQDEDHRDEENDSKEAGANRRSPNDTRSLNVTA